MMVQVQGVSFGGADRTDRMTRMGADRPYAWVLSDIASWPTTSGHVIGRLV
jgi:hypothetical protein